MGVAESDDDDAERDTNADSGGSLRHGISEMTDVDADKLGDDYGGHGRDDERTRK